MNKTCYKVIFNKKRGMMTAVAEHAVRSGKNVRDGRAGVSDGLSQGAGKFQMRTAAFSVWLAAGSAAVAPVWAAGIQADKSAPLSQQPTVLQTANGLPQVNIQTPSAGGVSVNQYRQFDVDKRGAILNNSRSNVQTQQAGWIQGNPWLARGEARVIVNQANSANPSLLNGYVEVAGRRADVVLANPAGIQVNGAGFINAAGVTLTTGRPVFDNGGLAGFQVREGNIAVGGGGLDTSDADYTRILARAAQINAGVWAKDLSVVSGSNDVATDGSHTQVSDGRPAPAVAIDTAQLGGMYADKITLVSTDKGPAIHHAGQAFAAAGGVTLSADGKIGNSGSIVAAGNTQSSSAAARVNVQATAFDNSGTVSSQGKTAIQSPKVSNSGLITSSDELNIRTQNLSNSRSMQAARFDIETGRLNNSGNMAQTGLQSLNIEAGKLNNSGLIGYADQDHASGKGGNASPAAPAAPSTATGAGSTQSQSQTAAAPLNLAQGRLKVSDGLNNSGTLTANDGIELNTQNSLANSGKLHLGSLNAQGALLDNREGEIITRQADIGAQTLDNRQGVFTATESLRINSQTADNRQGSLQSGGSLAAAVQTLDNGNGQLAVNQEADIKAASLLNPNGQIDTGRLKAEAARLDNRSGKIRSDEMTELKVSDGLENPSGLIGSAKNIRIHDGNQQTLTLNNASGEILAGQNLDIQAETLAKQGELAANQNLSLKLKDSFTAERNIRAGQGLHISSEGGIRNSRTLEGGRFVLLDAQNIENTANGVIQSGSDTRLKAKNLTNRGLINSNGLTLLDAGGTVLNIGTGRVYGDRIGIEAEKLVNREEDKGAVIAAREHLAVGAKEIVNEGSGFHKIESGKLQSGTSSSLITSLGTLSVGSRLNGDYDAEGSAETLANKGARIESGGNMALNVRQIHNLNSRLEIDKKVRIQSLGSEHSVSAPGNPEWWVNGKDGRFRQTGDHAKGQFDFTDGRAPVISDVWNEKQVNVDVYQDQLKHSEPGQIIAGGNLRVDGNEFLNQDSQILIGGTWQGADQSKVLKNSAAQSELVTTEKGYGKQTYAKKSKSFKWGRKDRNGYSIDAVRSIETKPFENDFIHYQERASALEVTDTATAAATNPTTVTHGGSTPAPVKTLNTDTKLPASGHYAVNPANPSYLVETDPAFTDYRQWLSSGYMLDALGVDPAAAHKRLGDGYYEQKLVNEQIARLTGYRRLDGYQSDEEQFKALMEAGITFARGQQLTPGIALSPEQVARLTADIVWLETQTLTLIDGSTVDVLAPKVYLTVKPGDINAHGGLISAGKLALDGAGSIVNSGTLAGRKIVDLSAADIQNSGVVQGGKVRLRGQDVNIEGGTVEADTLLAVEADRIRVASTTATGGNERNGQTQIDRVAGLYVNNASDGLLSLKANQSIDFVAATLRNEAAKGKTQIVSDGRIGLGTAKLEARGKRGELSDKNHRHITQTSETGTAISAAGDILVSAKDDLSIRQGSIESGGTVALSGRNVSITEGRQTLNLDESVYSKSRGFASKKTSLDQYRRQHDEAAGSSIKGKEVTVFAGQDINVRGSNVVSDGRTVLKAGNDVNITAAGNTYADHEFHERKRSGLSGGFKDGVLSVGAGKSSQKLNQDDASTSLTVSQVGSITGDTAIIAGNNLTTEAAVLATGGDMTLQGRNVSLNAGYTASQSDSRTETKQSGASVGITVNPFEAAKAGYDRNMQGGGYSGSVVGKTIRRDDAVGKAIHAAARVGVVTAGRRKSGESRHSGGTQAVVTSVSAQGDLNIIATEGNIRSEGAKLTAEGNALLSAAEGIELGFARDTVAQSGGRKRSGFSIDNREAIPIGTFNDKSEAQGSLDKATGTQLSAGGTALLQAQKADIDILGSSIAAQDDVTLIAGRNINIRSTRNSQNRSERQTTGGIGTAVISDTEHFAGWMKNRQDSNSKQVEQVKSQIGSLGGNVHIQAEGSYTQQVADVLAAKDLNITAKSVDVLADHNLSSSSQAERDVKIGTFAKISSPLIDLVNAAEGAVKSKADDRTQALQTLAAGAQAYSAYNTATGGGALAKAEVGFGFKTANSSQDQSQSLSQGNVLNAGGDLNIRSTEGDIRLQHTRATAADTLRLDSANNLILESGQSAQTADGKNSSLGASVGVGVSVGAQTGVYAYGEVGGSKGKNRYLAQTHDHTTLEADRIQLASQGDTTLKGATATARRIDADVKGRLNIESVQDHIEQENKQTGAGVRVQVSFGTAWEASGNFSQSKASGQSQTVTTQSGLFAGDGGYHVNADSVRLKGGAIASTAPKEQNELTANRFTFENIQNRSSYSASDVGLSGGYGENPDKEPGYTDGTSFSPSLPQYQKGGDNSTTYATLSEGRLNIAGKDTTVQELGINSDSESAHRAVAALPDLAKITEKQQIVAKATADVASAVSTYRQNQLAKAQEALSNAETELMGATFSGNQSDIEAAQGRLNEARENVKAWETGGSKTRALNAGTTLITGILGGQSEVQAAVNSASPYTAAIIGQTFGQNGSHPNEGLQLLAHAVNSGVLATVNGGSFEAGAVSGAGSELAAKVLTQTLFGEEAAANPSVLGEQEKTLVSDLSAAFGMVSGGLAGGSAVNAQIGAVAGQNAVENNQLGGYEYLIGGNAGVESLKGAVSLYKQQLENGKTIEEANKEVNKYLQGHGLTQHTGAEVLVYGSLALPIIAIGGKTYTIAALSSAGQGAITTVIIEGKPYKVSDLSYDASLGILVGKGLSKASESMFKWSNVRSNDLKANQIMRNSLIIPSLSTQYGVGKAGSGTASKILGKRDIILIEVPGIRKNIQKR
ncbi:hemagglutinin repeat-containing protein [Neisseria sp.]|uniref:two-partner secretion domain-containing protein n=1 Tax=Neisseria sp. TaxID=192066 RepID=UPI0026DBC966|nr:hemagglutinin repeat-containing protein [Neisseria sp.]MDO4907530.1 hemagglutinin repeat-containing protein [Neisseria sp.]